LPPSANEPKVAFRAWVRQVSKGLPPQDLAAISTASCANLVGILADHAGNADPRFLMVYVPIRGEIDPIFANRWAISHDWRLAVGRATSRTSVLQPVAVEPADLGPDGWLRERCETDAWDMLVPRNHVPIRAASLTAVVVPGLAFDRRGHRLGRGAGVYDRFLATLPPHVLRIGVIPAALVVPELPTEPHDVPMHFVVTEHEVIAANAPGC
jgi:5-formyltetrahydrofolate cyclo-ligase